MSRKQKISSLFAALLVVSLVSGCHHRPGRAARVETRARAVTRNLPPVILWAWERPEDLEFLDSQRFGVAFLAQTLTLKGDDVLLNPRRQPLKVSPATRLIAVTRVESQKNTGVKAGLTPAQREKLVTLISRTLELENVSGIQVDFDAVVSERKFYRDLLEDLRQKIPEQVALSMTALASFCIGDRWFDDLPVDEAVPMIFRMGADDERIKSFLAAGNDFREPLCQTSYGIALDEPLKMKFADARRLYVFGDEAWTEKNVALLTERIGMNYGRRLLASLLALLVFNNFSPPSSACGPSFITPVFAFKESPDLPFNEFAGGRIGIVQPEMGRKTLVIAYRYLNDGAFGSDEQTALVEALEGKAPEDNGDEAVKKWIAARKGLAKEGETLPDIYTERRYGGYDFFPNCSSNAFEVATETLKDRVASYGADDQNVRAWLAAQDIVFQNCGGGASTPPELGFESPEWLRQDREYQIGAALLYSLNFDGARAQFEKIAADLTSPWQQTAGYVIARTLVRQASFAKEAARKRALYEQAESHLQILLAKGGKFSGASQRLLGLVKYRMRPEERVGELGKILADGNGNENLRQDLIDYVWLLDKFESQIWQAEAIRKAAQQPLAPAEGQTPPPDDDFSKRAAARREAIDRGDLIDLGMEVKNSDGPAGYATWLTLDFKYDATDDEILRAFQTELHRDLTPDETKQLKENHSLALSQRKWMLSPNQKWAYEDHEGSYDRGDELPPQMLPVFLRSDELTDWLFTFKTEDQRAFAHAFSKWRAGGSGAWLVAALAKANAMSRGLESLLRAAERIGRDAPAFPSVAYQVVRLNIALGRKTEARKLLDDIFALPPQALSVSAENILREQRTALAADVSEFLKFAQRRPVTFNSDGSYGKIGDFMKMEKEYWNPDYGQTKEEFEQKLEDRFRELLLWDDRFAFDDETVEVFNWHFPLPVLSDAARDPAVPNYLRRRLLLAVWTRAVLLKNEKFAQQAAREVVKLAPELSSTFNAYLDAATAEERRDSALYILLRQPSLSPYVVSGLPDSNSAEDLDYYFESSWWCTPSDTVYNEEGQEVPVVVSKPAFLTPEQLAAARRERAALVAIGDGKSYLGKRVLEWAKTSPADERVPEALYIAAKANSQYKYGCQSWEYDYPTKEAAEKLLRERYPRSPWTAKLEPPPN